MYTSENTNMVVAIFFKYYLQNQITRDWKTDSHNNLRQAIKLNQSVIRNK